ncbi:MAG: hypothetical protein ACQEQJ_02795 [Halobacteriota archaeon]|uniref:hypothetical protein n=1 Tax=Halodesulfurarchaeum sp. HSR-GB TaxID=3074077 RepID=UPI00285930A7|nr:hypothetical protein [Halodesulfurarchaeum sp. HSR-GB]MDR5657313.1 hypothetical protein [Halodesulfurarchaeum sp. HSR-GB]
MKDANLLADVLVPILFFLGALVFTGGWLETGQITFAIVALLLVLVTIYGVYRLGKLYLN